MTLVRAMELPDVSTQPLWAQIVFVISAAIVYGVVHFGVKRGKATKPAGADASHAAIAAVVVDSASLNRLTAAAEAMNMTLIELNQIGRQYLADAKVQRNEAAIKEAERRGYEKGQASRARRAPSS